MDRRTFVARCRGRCLPYRSPHVAQQAGKVPRIGFFYLGTAPMVIGHLTYRIREGLHERGYVEGQNVVIEARFGRWQDRASARLGAELLRSRSTSS